MLDKQLAESDIRMLGRLIEQYNGEINELESELSILRHKLENVEDTKRIILEMLDAESDT